MVDGHHDGIGGVKATDDIGQRNTHPHRVAIWVAGHTHDAAEALDDLVVGCAVMVGANLTESRDGTINDIGLHGLASGIIEAVLGHLTGDEVFDNDIRLPNQFVHNRRRIGMA